MRQIPLQSILSAFRTEPIASIAFVRARYITVGALCLIITAIPSTAVLADCQPAPVPAGGNTAVNCGSGTFNGRLGNVDTNNHGTIDAVDVTVAPTPTSSQNAVIDSGNQHAIVFDDGAPGGSTISVGTAGNKTDKTGAQAIVTSNVTTNAGDPLTRADVNPGRNTIQVNNNYNITVWANGQVHQTGTATRAEAINVLGTNNTIINYGLIQNDNANSTALGAAIWFQDLTVDSSKFNTIDNFGTIRVLANRSVIGSSSTATDGAGAVHFTNESGARVEGNILFASGNDVLQFFPNSVVTGNIDGGGGTNALILNGTSGSFDTLPGALTNFTTLMKTGDGQWNVTGTLTGFTAVTVQQGILGLTGDNTGYSGSVVVNPGATLEARAQSLPTSPPNLNNITDNGTVRFTQNDNGTYVGQITGAGSVEKVGTGVTTLSPDAAAGNTYLGGTSILQGGIAIGTDSALGASNGSLILNGGFLQLTANMNLAAAREITIGSNNGAIDTQGFTSTVAQGITGPGAFTKYGTGTLILDGANDYQGGTTIAAGTLQLGNGGASGSILGNVLNNGSLVFDRSDISIFSGAISGIGSVMQAGSGTTILTANSNYSGGTIISAGTLQLGNGGTSGSIMGDVLNNGALVFDRSNPLQFKGLISGTGSVSQIGTGTTELSAANNYSGLTTVSAGSLRAAATNTFSPNSAVAIAGTGTLDLNGFNQTVPSVTNAGNIKTGGNANTNLTVTSAYFGANGLLHLNTFLGTDGSPSDRLVLNGSTATGTTRLQITNTNGPGAETTSDGILVIQTLNGGTTTPGAFSLVGEVRGGAFDYALFRGGIDGTSSINDWFLRSSFVVPGPNPSPNPPGPFPIPPGPDLPIDPPPGILPPGEYPIIGPELATYGVVQPIARQLGTSVLGTLHDRVGDTLLDAPCLTTNDKREKSNQLAAMSDCGLDGWRPWATWARVFGQQIDNRYHAFTEPGASGQILGFQSGLDLWRGSLINGHRDAAGIYLSYANANASVSGLVTDLAALNYVMQHTGRLNLDAWSAGAYWTHYGPSGWYFDAVTQLTRYNGTASTQFANLDAIGSGFIASLETGYPISMPVFGPGFVLEPQVQILWQHVQFNDANDGLGDVALGTTDGATGRVGLRGRWTFITDQGQQWQPYLRANYWQDWGAQATTVYSGLDHVPLREAAKRVEIGGGFSVKINTAISAYANTDYQFAVDNSDGTKRSGVRGSLGVRYTW